MRRERQEEGKNRVLKKVIIWNCNKEQQEYIYIIKYVDHMRFDTLPSIRERIDKEEPEMSV